MATNPSPPEPADLVEIAREVATRAADLLMDLLAAPRTVVDTKTSATDMVTEVDRASERLIVDSLLSARPHDGIVGEEGAAREGQSGIRWIVDPVDGTTNYLYRHPGFAVSIAAEAASATDEPAAGRLLAGVVVDPVHNDVFTAHVGGGAQRNGVRISCSDLTEPRTALVATGFAYDPDRRARQAAVLAHVIPLVRDIRRMGAASVDLCSVACGRVDAYYEKGLAPWDWAAGALIAREAGAVVAGLPGDADSPGFVLAAPPALFAPLRALLLEAGARDA